MSAIPEVPVILLVDDEPAVPAALIRTLRHEPYDFISATSAETALDILAHRPVDVVVSDEKMPGMSGSEFLGLVRRRHPHTIRMILSGQATLDAAVRAINEGEVHRFFLKPCNPIDLIVSIKQALIHQRLERQSRRLLLEYQKQASLLSHLQPGSPDLLRLDVDDQGALIVDKSDAECDVTELLAQMEAAMNRRAASR